MTSKRGKPLTGVTVVGTLDTLWATAQVFEHDDEGAEGDAPIPNHTCTGDTDVGWDTQRTVVFEHNAVCVVTYDGGRQWASYTHAVLVDGEWYEVNVGDIEVHVEWAGEE
ncbi:MAG: hypothetical protein P1V36_01630 [Planctomycetota bacterium]|nr:hypothetical protein [Planctomycetota bacterium]